MSKVKSVARGFANDLWQGWRTVGLLIASLARRGKLGPAVIVLVMGISIGLACVGLGDWIAGEPGAWVGSAVGLVAAGLFMGRVLNEL
jgi:hypothetical protein